MAELDVLTDTPAKAAAEPAEAREEYRIMLVDDDANERKGVRFLIERADMPLIISEAPNGKRALELIRQQPVDILFTDVKMPYMDGLELASAVCGEFPQIRIIIFSAYGEFEYAKRAMEANAVNYLLKPIDVEEFSHVMRSIIRQCEAETAQARQRQRRMNADKKLMWINILNGKQIVDAALKKQMLDLGYDPSVPITLLHLETQEDYFPHQEEQFLNLLETAISCKWEYINFYPNSSYILLFGELEHKQTEAIAGRICEGVQRKGGISVMIADCCDDPSLLAAQARRIDTVRRQFFGWKSPILFVSELGKVAQHSSEAIEKEWKRTEQSLASKDKQEIMARIQALLSELTLHGAVSTAYSQYIFCDLISKLYEKYGLGNSPALQQMMQKLGDRRGKKAVLELFQEALDSTDLTQNAPAQDVSRVVQKVIRIIKQQYSSDLSLDYLAEQVGLAPSYLSFVFKRETGENLIKYLTDYRMERARQMLAEGSFKIVQVARQCGYENPSYFNRLFKNACGVTPKQYREKYNG